MPNYNFVNSIDFKINVESDFIYNFYNSQESKNNDNLIVNNNQTAYSFINLKIDISDKYDRRNIIYNRFLETIVTEINRLSTRDDIGNLYNMSQSEIGLFNKISDHEKDLLTLNLDVSKDNILVINKFYQVPAENYQSSISFITQNKKVNINGALREKFINKNKDNIFFTRSLKNSIDKFSLMFRQNIDETSRNVNNDENAFNTDEVSYVYRASSKISENFTPIKTTPITQYTSQSGIFYYALTGVLVEKYSVEDKEDNIFTKKDTKFFKTNIIPNNIEEDSASEFTKTISLDINDSAVKYGSEYFYIVYPVYAVTLPKKNDYYLVETFLMCDYPYITENIVCKEFKRPVSPTNLMFRYINSEKCLNIEWAKPFERQGDIKGYQIFKRKKLDEPYSLIGQIEFLEEDAFYERNINITPSLIEKSRYNKTYFIDKDFNINEVQIYTVCSIDARGQVSNYSEQIAVYYDYYSKKVIVDLVSTPGAPLHMPNLLIPRKTKFYDNEENIISNTPYEKDVSKISLYVTPEYESILLGENEGATNIIADKYKFSIFKLENNQQVINDINIKLQ